MTEMVAATLADTKTMITSIGRLLHTLHPGRKCRLEPYVLNAVLQSQLHWHPLIARQIAS